MTTLNPGDRVRIQSTGDDGLPLVRYGFVGRCGGDDEPVVVLLDDDLNGSTIVDRSVIEPVTVTTVELRLHGTDLLHDPALRRGLVNLWSAEAEAAGLEIGALRFLDPGPVTSDGDRPDVLAEMTAGGQRYVLRAVCQPTGDPERDQRANGDGHPHDHPAHHDGGPGRNGTGSHDRRGTGDTGDGETIRVKADLLGDH